MQAQLCSPDISLAEYLDKPLLDAKFDSSGLNLLDFQILPHFGVEYFGPRSQKLFQDVRFYDQLNLTLTDTRALWIEDGVIEIFFADLF